LIPGLAISFFIDWIRFRWQKGNKIFHWIFKDILRPSEKKGFTGATYLLLSLILCILFFDKYIAITCILFAIISDTAAALIGKKFGRIKLFGKTLEGFFAFLVVSLIIVFIVEQLQIYIGLLGALTAAVVEIAPIRLNVSTSFFLTIENLMCIFVFDIKLIFQFYT